MKRMTLPLGRWFPRMALRLTGIPTPDDSSGSSGDAPARPGGLRIATAAPTTQAGSAFGAQLRDQARLQLAMNQLDRYKALFDRAAEHDDSQTRYHARLRLIEEGLAATGKTSSQAQATQLFVAVADGGAHRPRGGAARADSPELRRRRAVRAVEPRRSPRPVQGRTPARPRPPPPQAQPAGARPAAQGPPPEQAAASRGPGPGRPRPQAGAQGPAGQGPDAQPVHDRPRRGGDAPEVPRRRRPGGGRDHHRRYGLKGPHDRDRR